MNTSTLYAILNAQIDLLLEEQRDAVRNICVFRFPDPTYVFCPILIVLKEK